VVGTRPPSRPTPGVTLDSSEILYFTMPSWEKDMIDLVRWLFPETTGGGMVDLVDSRSWIYPFFELIAR